ncbi:MAG TPA: transposase [Chthoniobacterales bacterium]|nr:transposase [Chthoniobacterales bacterium]
MIYRGFQSKLHHEIPHWVDEGALFHIRIRLNLTKQQRTLTDPSLANKLLESADFYETQQRWQIALFLLMPDHVHALLSFGRDKAMSVTVGDWKHFHSHTNHVIWQEGYFDHRLRDDRRGAQLLEKISYIRNNPVAAGLCRKGGGWPWVIDRSERVLVE